jgi:serine/threonine protein kinase
MPTQGLLHRDVEPANIMLTEPDDEGERRALLADSVSPAQSARSAA